MTHSKNSVLVLAFCLSLVVTAAAQQSSQSKCSSVSEQERAHLSAYIQKKYKVPESVKLSVAEDTIVNDTCYHKLLFHSDNAQQPFSQTLYLSPDSRFLLTEVLDLNIDPLEAERKEHHELTAALTRGKFPELGSADAPVTIVEFADFQCPFCQHAAAILKQLQSTPDGRKVRVVFRHFPLGFHPWAQIAAEAAACVNLQSSEHFWELHDWIFENQKSLTAANARTRLLEVAGKMQGMDMKAYQTCVETSQTSEAIRQDVAVGAAHEVRGTPTFFINGRRIAGMRSLEDLRALIADAEKEESPSVKTAQTIQDPNMQGARQY